MYSLQMAKKETPVSEIMSSPVKTVAAETSIAEAAETLASEHIGSLVIGTEIVKGIATETDVVRAIGDELDLGATPISEIMSDPVVTIRPHEAIHVAGERMGHNGVKKLPVTKSGEPVGIVTTTDIAHFFPRDRIMMSADPDQDVGEGEFE
jgi:CBS domain-containing protein